MKKEEKSQHKLQVLKNMSLVLKTNTMCICVLSLHKLYEYTKDTHSRKKIYNLNGDE